MSIEQKNWRWLRALVIVAGICFLIAGSYGKPAAWMALAAIFFVTAGATYRRRKNISPLLNRPAQQ
jgi:membrane protease YdiL (CAAX protease family)